MRISATVPTITDTECSNCHMAANLIKKLPHGYLWLPLQRITIVCNLKYNKKKFITL